jgi:hypothetical protein
VVVVLIVKKKNKIMKFQLVALCAIFALTVAEKPKTANLLAKDIERFVDSGKQQPGKKTQRRPFVIPKEDDTHASSDNLAGFDDNDGVALSERETEAHGVDSHAVESESEDDRKESEDSQSYDDHSSSASYSDGGSFYTDSKDSFKAASSSTGPGLEDTEVVSSLTDDSFIVTDDTDSYNRSNSDYSEERSSGDVSDTHATLRSSYSDTDDEERSHSGRFHSDDEEFDSEAESTDYYSNDSSNSYSESNSHYD